MYAALVAIALQSVPISSAFSPPYDARHGRAAVGSLTYAGGRHIRRRRRSAFTPQSSPSPQSPPPALSSSVRMDIEDDGSRDAGREVRRILGRDGSTLSPKLPRVLYGSSIGNGESGSRRAENERSVADVQGRHGMPWVESVGEYTPPEFELSPKVYGCEERREQEPLGIVTEDEWCDVDADGSASPLLFMPFWTWQISYMKSELSGLRPLPTTTPCERFDVGLNHNPSQGARIVNHAYASDEYRKIRMTYYDAGDSVQVFNSLWYPHPKYNLPVLGIDLLAFGRKKYLTVVDFQPIHGTEDEHSARYEKDVLGPIRTDYPSLQGKMTDRFYDSSRHFSSQTLFGRFEDEKIVADEVWPAFRRSVQAHVDLVRGSDPDETSSGMGLALEGHKAYDNYSARRDPAHALFTRIFGKEWADGYVHGFLFDLSGGPEDEWMERNEENS